MNGIDYCLWGKKKKAIRLMKHELRRKIMTEFVGLRAKTNSYLQDDDNNAIKRANGTRKCVTKRKLKFRDYKNCLMNNKVILKLQKRFKSEAHKVYIEEVNKITLSKRLQTYDGITSNPYLWHKSWKSMQNRDTK